MASQRAGDLPAPAGAEPGGRQLDLVGCAAMTRLFVAVWPPPEVVAVLAALDRPEVPGVRWSTPEQWMVKVRPLGHVDDRVVAPLVDALEAELDGAPVAECVLGPATRRLGGQWLGAPVAGLDDLAAVVFEVTGELVPVTHPQPFQADVVLARGRVPRSSPAGQCRRRGRRARCRWLPTVRRRGAPGTRTSPRFPWVPDCLTCPR